MLRSLDYCDLIVSAEKRQLLNIGFLQGSPNMAATSRTYYDPLRKYFIKKMTSTVQPKGNTSIHVSTTANELTRSNLQTL